MKYVIIISSLVVAACSSRQEEHETDVPTAAISNTIKLTAAQYKAANLELGKISRGAVGSTLHVNGMLDVPPQNKVTISAPLGGFVKHTHLLNGMKVRKGEVLAVLENQDYIQLQQDYLDNQSRLEFAASEFNRQQELAKENINAQKTLQQAKSQFHSLQVVVKALAAKLAMININASSLTEENISSSIKLYSPLNGFITKVNVTVGQFVNTTDIMFSIVNIEHIHAELQVFEKDIQKINMNQKVSFQVVNDNKTRTASVFLIGKEISPERTVGVHCHLDKEDDELLPGMYVTANIETASYEADVLPVSAVISFEGEDFIFTTAGSNEQFEMVKVRSRSANADMAEVEFPEGFDKSRPIVVRGAFDLLGLLRNLQEE